MALVVWVEEHASYDGLAVGWCARAAMEGRNASLASPCLSNEISLALAQLSRFGSGICLIPSSARFSHAQGNREQEALG